MYKIFLPVFCLLSFSVNAQFGKFHKKDSTKVNVIKSISDKFSGSSLSSDEIIAGLKEALSKGAIVSTDLLHKPNGYFGNAAIKILMPPEAEKVASSLRKAGMGSMVDKAILSMNEAAEDAAGNVSQIFLSAIKNMSVADGVKILRGNNHAATDYLKSNTFNELSLQMKPVIEASLQKVNATQYWETVFNAYNKFSLNKVNPDLTSYVLQKALDGLFYSIALEEEKIRENPAERTTDLLKKVFAK